MSGVTCFKCGEYGHYASQCCGYGEAPIPIAIANVWKKDDLVKKQRNVIFGNQGGPSPYGIPCGKCGGAHPTGWVCKGG